MDSVDGFCSLKVSILWLKNCPTEGNNKARKKFLLLLKPFQGVGGSLQGLVSHFSWPVRQLGGREAKQNGLSLEGGDVASVCKVRCHSLCFIFSDSSFRNFSDILDESGLSQFLLKFEVK